MIAEIALKAKQDYDKTGDKAMDRLSEGYRQQTEGRAANRNWTGAGSPPAQQRTEPAAAKPEPKKKAGEAEEENTEGKGGLPGVQLPGSSGSGSEAGAESGDAGGKSGVSWIDEIFNTVSK